MNFLRTLACAFVLLLTATESVAGEAWRIVQSAGPVKAGGAGFMPAAVQPNQALPSDAWVETGAAGRVVLARGLETIALGPSSRVQLPSEEVNGNTQVLQTIGSALYQVGKQKAPHFQVDTPYLAALVKGTTFTVTVTDAGSSVDVSEGLVQVATPNGSDAEFVRPGFSGVVTKHDSGNVVVVESSSAPVLPDATPSESDKAAGTDETAASDAPGETTVIVASIGDAGLDVEVVSDGLVTTIDPPGGDATDSGSASSGGGKGIGIDGGNAGGNGNGIGIGIDGGNAGGNGNGIGIGIGGGNAGGNGNGNGGGGNSN